MRTPEEITEEIKRLRAIKPPEAMGAVIARRIALVIADLEAPGQYIGDDSHWPSVAAARRWLMNETNTRPSEGWGKEKA